MISELLTIIISFNCANQTEELNHPTESRLHLRHKHTGQDLKHTETETQAFSKHVFPIYKVYVASNPDIIF